MKKHSEIVFEIRRLEQLLEKTDCASALTDFEKIMLVHQYNERSAALFVLEWVINLHDKVLDP